MLFHSIHFFSLEACIVRTWLRKKWCWLLIKKLWYNPENPFRNPPVPIFLWKASWLVRWIRVQIGCILRKFRQEHIKFPESSYLKILWNNAQTRHPNQKTKFSRGLVQFVTKINEISIANFWIWMKLTSIYIFAFWELQIKWREELEVLGPIFFLSIAEVFSYHITEGNILNGKGQWGVGSSKW